MRLTNSGFLKRHVGMLGISVCLMAGGASSALAQTGEKMEKTTK